MSDPNTIRVLEIDGGGERGYLSLEWLRRFIAQWGVDEGDIWKHFDVICGTSIGGVLASSLAFGKRPIELVPFFRDTAQYIFSLSSLVRSLRPNLPAKLALIALDIPFYQSSGSTANAYGYGLLKTELQNFFGTATLQDLKTNVLIPSYKENTLNYVLCSNIQYPDFVGQNELISNVCLATASAPIYFPELVLSNTNPGTLNGTYIDGGVYQNNPARFGIALGKRLKPNSSRICVLSIGTGLGEQGFDPGNPDMIDPRVQPFLKANSTLSFDSIQTIFELFSIASTGGQESVAKAISIESKYALEQLYLDQIFYYRFQPNLDLNLNTELDNTDTAILDYYQNLANTKFDADIDNINTFIGHLRA